MNTLILTMLLNNCSTGAVPAKQLAPVIISAAQYYKVDAKLIARIIITESGCLEKAYNASTQDYGLMQLNIKTMKAYNISESCAMSWFCNLNFGVYHLSRMRKHKACAYNLGPTGAKRHPEACEAYLAKLEVL